MTTSGDDNYTCKQDISDMSIALWIKVSLPFVCCIGASSSPPPRHEQTTIFRLRTGHCGLRAHLKRIGVMNSALCDCKEAEQTVHHIVQDCPIWRKQRHQLWPQDELATNKLWGTAEDLRRTTQFLATWTEGLSTADGPQKKSTSRVGDLGISPRFSLQGHISDLALSGLTRLESP